MDRLTESSFWDSEWKKINLGNYLLKSSHFYFGKNGVFTNIILKYVNLDGVTSVLEIGGGGANYRLLSLAKWFNLEVAAIDYSPVAIEVVKKLFAKNKQSANFINSDFSDFATQKKYDLVVHWGVLEHFTDPIPLLKKSFDLIKPGGQLLFTMPNMVSFGAIFWKKWAPDSWSKHHYHTDEVIKDALKSIGFEAGEIFYFGLPLITSPWERKNIFTILLSLSQSFVSAVARVLPICSFLTSRKISSERGFHAYKSIK